MEFAFGLIADIQYVDAADGTTHDGSMVRRHRQSLETLRTACGAFCTVVDPPIEHCVLLGDVLDGKCKTNGITDQCLLDVVCALSTGPQGATWHAAVGNHDLVCLSRAQILETFIPQTVRASCTPERLYYDISPCPGLRFIFLDGYDMSVLGPSKPEHKSEVEQLLAAKNPNLAVPGAAWFDGLGPMERRFVPYNGAVGADQLAWLERTLAHCRNAKERCFLFTHMPLYAACCRPSGMMLNAEVRRSRTPLATRPTPPLTCPTPPRPPGGDGRHPPLPRCGESRPHPPRHRAITSRHPHYTTRPPPVCRPHAVR